MYKADEEKSVLITDEGITYHTRLEIINLSLEVYDFNHRIRSSWETKKKNAIFGFWYDKNYKYAKLFANLYDYAFSISMQCWEISASIKIWILKYLDVVVVYIRHRYVYWSIYPLKIILFVFNFFLPQVEWTQNSPSFPLPPLSLKKDQKIKRWWHSQRIKNDQPFHAWMPSKYVIISSSWRTNINL